ncbi:MAG TPA: helix-turn-helix transcriptional regulator [Ktedonobacterales bacterium]
MDYEDTPDDLDTYIAERTAKNPAFPQLMEAARRQRLLLRELAEKREELGLSQAEVAARMGTSQSALARLERGEGNPTLATVERYASAMGKKIEWRIS